MLHLGLTSRYGAWLRSIGRVFHGQVIVKKIGILFSDLGDPAEYILGGNFILGVLEFAFLIELP